MHFSSTLVYERAPSGGRLGIIEPALEGARIFLKTTLIAIVIHTVWLLVCSFLDGVSSIEIDMAGFVTTVVIGTLIGLLIGIMIGAIRLTVGETNESPLVGELSEIGASLGKFALVLAISGAFIFILVLILGVMSKIFHI